MNELILISAIASFWFAVGNVLLGHFEFYTPRGKRLAKFFAVLAICQAITYLLGLFWAIGILLIAHLPVIYVHAYYLPKRGINGWTAKPWRRYVALRGWRHLYREWDV